MDLLCELKKNLSADCDPQSLTFSFKWE